MRIAVDILSAALGGPGQTIRDFLPHLCRRAAGDEVHVLAAHPGLIAVLPRCDGLVVHEIAAARRVAPRLLWQRWRMASWCRRHGIDVVFLPQGLTAMRSGPPIVVMQRDSMFFTNERFGRARFYAAMQGRFARLTLARAARAVFVSRAILELALERGWVRPDRARVVSYGVDTPALRGAADESLAARLRAGPPFALAVGSVMPHKNHGVLVDAVTELRRRGRTDIRLLIAGEAPAARPAVGELNERIAACGVSDGVALLGQLDRPVLGAHYAAARMLVCVSLLESFGQPLLEAMEFGVPILCSPLPAFEEVAADAAERVDPNDPRAVADAMAALWDDEPRRCALAARGRKRAALFHTAQAADAIYEELQRAAATDPRRAASSGDRAK